MATHRNRYVKVHLFEASATRLQDAKVVGQGDDYLLLERAAPKERKAGEAPRKRKPRTQAAQKANAQPAATEHVHGA